MEFQAFRVYQDIGPLEAVVEDINLKLCAVGAAMKARSC